MSDDITQLSTERLLIGYRKKHFGYGSDFGKGLKDAEAYLEEGNRRDAHVVAQNAELAEQQRYILQLEREVTRLTTQVELDAAFGKPTRMEMEAQVNRLIQRNESLYTMCHDLERQLAEAREWEPMPLGKRLLLNKRTGNRPGSLNHYIATRTTVAGMELPRNYAVFRRRSSGEATDGS